MLDTYGSAEEIELKRKREVGLLELAHHVAGSQYP